MSAKPRLKSSTVNDLLAQRAAEALSDEGQLKRRAATDEKISRELDRLDRLLTECRKPASGGFSYAGLSLFAPQHVKELAEAAELAVPPEARWVRLAGNLSRAFYVALAQREDDCAAKRARPGVSEIAARGRDFFSSLRRHMGSPDVRLQLVRRVDGEIIIGLLCDLAEFVPAVESIKVNRGVLPNNFSRRLLEELALHFRDAFHCWPVLKNRDRERDGGMPAARWLRLVCERAMPKRPAAIVKLPYQQNVLSIELTRVNRWKSSTLIKEFEDAIHRAKRR